MTIGERIEYLMQSIESHDRQIGELTNAVSKLVNVADVDAIAIRTQARIADVHEKRLSQLEDNQ
jgi:hypothetical protein